MRILQIANDYLNPLFSKMFYAIKKQGFVNEVVVPISYKGIISETWDSDIRVFRCFHPMERFFFFIKQKRIFNVIDNNIDMAGIKLIHAHTLFSNGFPALLIHNKYKTPYIIAVRNTDVNVFFRYKPWLRKLGNEIMVKASAIVFLSPAYKENVINKYVSNKNRKQVTNKSVIIPNGISNVFLENKNSVKQINRGKLSILFVGEITKNKNIGAIIKTGYIRKEKGEDVTITIVGNIVDKSCAKYLDDPIVQYYPKCQQNELINIYRNADIFMMPSHKETFGLVYVEAMSQGLPVIYTKGQGFDQYFEDGIVGYSVNDKNAYDISEKIDLILSSYSEISANCLKNSDLFSWDRIAEQYKILYENIIN